MKKQVLFIMLLFSFMQQAFADRNVVLFKLNSSIRLESILSGRSDRLDIDSAIVWGRVEFSDMLALRQMTVYGSLRGIDLSKAEIIGDSIYSNTFWWFAEYINQEGGISGNSVSSGKLEYITLPDYIEAICSRAFCQSKLRSISIPRGIRYIASDAFEGCDSLRSVYIKEPHPAATDGNSPLYGDSTTLYVPIGSKSMYMTNESWSGLDMSHVKESPELFVTRHITISGGDLRQYMSESGEQSDSLVISGYMDKDDCSLFTVSCYNGKVTGVDFSNCRFPGDTLPPKLFYNMGSGAVNVMYVTIPEGIKSIGRLAFWTTRLQALSLPSTLEHIGSNAFCGNSTIHGRIDIPYGVKTLEQCCFQGCYNISEMHIPSTVEKLSMRSLAFFEFKNHDVYIDRMTPPDSDDDDSGNLYNIGPFASNESNPGWTLYIPVGAKQNYLNSIYFKDFWCIVETPELTGGATAIDGVASGITERGNGYADGVYTLDGKRIADTMTDGMAKGLYVVKRGASISKVAVR